MTAPPRGLASLRAVLIAGFPAGPWGTNCYVAATGPGTECVVVDPGKDAAAGVAEVVARAPAQAGRRAGHPRARRPHVVRRPGRRHVRRHRLDPPRATGTCSPTRWPACRAETTAMLLGGKLRVRRARRRRRSSPTRQELELAGLTFVVDHTPGHTAGSVTFRTPYDAEQDVSEVMFSGDLLFAGLDRPHRPARAATTRRCCAACATKVLPLRRRHRGAARPRRADVASAASARPTPSCWTCRRAGPRARHPRTVNHEPSPPR